MAGPEIGDARPDEAAACEAVLRALPDWFGIEESIREYVRDLVDLETIVAVEGDRMSGFLALKEHNPRAVEIHVMAVRPERHGRGVGRAMVEVAERRLNPCLILVKHLACGRGR